MAGSVFDSAMFSKLFPTGEIGRLFTDSAELRAMLLVEGMLAKVQGDLGVIPAESAQAITRAAMEVQLDPGALAQATGENGVSVPALVAAFRAEMQAPEHAAFVHWGATSQDIIDTGLMLRLRQALTLVEKDLTSVLARLSELAEAHAALPMPARTYGQHATPTSFGAVVAGWGAPLLGLLDELPELRRTCLLVSLSGAAGTSGALGPQATETRKALAGLLNLQDPGRSWHTDRTPVLRIGDWLTRATLALGKLGEDAIELTQTGIGEIRLGGSGASSTMPQKQNPVGPSVLVALARQQTGLFSTLQGAAMHRHQRDGAAWFTEWMCLPQIVLGAGAAGQVALRLVQGIEPNAEAMRAALEQNLGLIHAEALSFELARHMPRPEAQATTKALCREAVETGTPLRDVVARAWPQIDTATLFDPAEQLGLAPEEARSFARRVTERSKE
ncbi:3-carboxy-cis,cis-muconate cycloisomerase [Ruegeria marisrubri]|uniref:3-carboxy-cis,cis-muconate cycloisomerase n=1 Tax=Ruegeria marisrubri TaxID=1685379 RepID=A0A0X3TX86_9RHOB|nr:adenylosuccinate lyase family protein [Ruegeria marisrubri]KUJ80353.1 3-carboxy-cis,cis-muconate cycloisomerase [Ruegeria marisrubri]